MQDIIEMKYMIQSKKILRPSFKKKLIFLKNLYGDGNSSKKIIMIIKKLNLKNFNTQKKITY